MQCGAGLCYQDIPNQIFGYDEKKEHFEVAFELHLRYIISILINDGAGMAC